MTLKHIKKLLDSDCDAIRVIHADGQPWKED